MDSSSDDVIEVLEVSSEDSNAAWNPVAKRRRIDSQAEDWDEKKDVDELEVEVLDIAIEQKYPIGYTFSKKFGDRCM